MPARHPEAQHGEQALGACAALGVTRQVGEAHVGPKGCGGLHEQRGRPGVQAGWIADLEGDIGHGSLSIAYPIEGWRRYGRRGRLTTPLAEGDDGRQWTDGRPGGL